MVKESHTGQTIESTVSEAKGRTNMVPTGPGHGFTQAGDYDQTEQKEV